MLNRKGQGLTEYALILLLVVMIGCLVWFHADIKEQISTIYAAIETDLKSIAGDERGNYDTDETTRVAKTLVHFTTLSEVGPKGGSLRVAWFIDGSGQRVYFPYRDTNGLHDTSDLQGIHWGHDYTVQHDADGGMTTYFEGTDGNYYKITDYTDRETTLTKYNGTPTGFIRRA